MSDESTDEQYDESGQPTPDSDSMRSPNRELAEESDPVDDADSAARATRTNASSEEDASSDQGQDAPRSNVGFTNADDQGSNQWDSGRLAQAMQQTPDTPLPRQAADTRDDPGNPLTPRPRQSSRVIGQIPPLRQPVDPANSDPSLDAQSPDQGSQPDAQDFQQQSQIRQPQIAQVNNSPAYQGDDGRWKKRVVDENGAIHEYDALDAGLGVTDSRTGDIYLQTASGPQKIGNDPIAAQLGKLVQQRSQIQNQIATDQDAIDSSKDGLKTIARNLDQYGGIPQRLEAQILRYAPSSLYPSDPNDPATLKAAAAYQTAQDQLAQFKAAHPEYDQDKAQQTALVTNIQQRQTDLDAQKAAINTNLANAEYVRVNGTMPEGDTPAIAPSDASLSDIYSRAAEIAGQTGVPRSAAFFSALSEAKARGMTTAGGISIDQQLQSVPPAQWLPQLNPDQLRQAFKSGAITRPQMHQAIAARDGATLDTKTPGAADNPTFAPQNNGVGAIEDFVTRIGAKNAELLNRGGEGISRFVSGDSAATQWFKGNADAAQKGIFGVGQINPALDDTTAAKVARGLGSVLASVPATTAGLLLTPEAFGTAATTILARGLGMAIGAAPSIVQFGSSAFAEAYNDEMKRSGDKEYAMTAGSKAALETLKALPIYMTMGALGGKVAGALTPELASPLRQAFMQFLGNGAANTLSSGALRVMNGQPFLPDAEGATQDWLNAVLHGGHEGEAQAKKLEFVGASQDVMAGSDPQLLQYQRIAANAGDAAAKATDPVEQAQAQDMADKANAYADTLRKNAADFLQKVGAPQIAPGEKSDPLAQSISDLHDSATGLRAKIGTIQDEGGVAGGEQDQLKDTEDQLHAQTRQMLARVPADMQARIARAAAPDVDWDAASQANEANPTTHFATAELGEALRNQAIPPENQRAMRQWARSRGVNPDVADLISNQALGAKAVKDLSGALRGGSIDPATAETLKNKGLLHPSDPGDPNSPVNVTSDAKPLFPEAMQRAITAKPEAFRYAHVGQTPADALNLLARGGMQRMADTARRMLPKPAVAMPGPMPEPGQRPESGQRPGSTQPAPAPRAAPQRPEEMGVPTPRDASLGRDAEDAAGSQTPDAATPGQRQAGEGIARGGAGESGAGIGDGRSANEPRTSPANPDGGGGPNMGPPNNEDRGEPPTPRDPIIPGLEHPLDTAEREAREASRNAQPARNNQAAESSPAQKELGRIRDNLVERPRRVLQGYLDGRPPEETGAFLGLTPEQSRNAYHVMRNHAADLLRQRGFGEGDIRDALTPRPRTPGGEPPPPRDPIIPGLEHPLDAADREQRRLEALRSKPSAPTPAEITRERIVSKIADLPKAIILGRLEGRTPEELSRQLGITQERAARGGYAIGRQIENTMIHRGIDPASARESMTPRPPRQASAPEESRYDKPAQPKPNAAAPGQMLKSAESPPAPRLTLQQRDAMAEGHKAAAPQVFADAKEQVGQWANRFRKLFNGFDVSDKSDNTGGLSYDRASNRMKVSWNEVANSAGITYREALRNGASESEARQAAAGKVRSILDEELRHVSDVRANGDAATKALWDSLPPEIQDATKGVYSRDNPTSDIADKNATQLGYEYKRILSQHGQTGEVSELAEITKVAAEKAAKAGNAGPGGWVRGVMDSLKRMADWLRGNAGGETARQLDALHSELGKITSGEALAPTRPGDSNSQTSGRPGSENSSTETLASSPAKSVPPALLKAYGGRGGGHHIPAKSAFRGDRSYNDNKVLAIPNEELDRLGVHHPTITAAQQTLYRAFFKTGRNLTWPNIHEIETKALVSGGMKPAKAAATATEAIKKLKKAGVKGPTRIPWGK